MKKQRFADRARTCHGRRRHHYDYVPTVRWIATFVLSTFIQLSFVPNTVKNVSSYHVTPSSLKVNSLAYLRNANPLEANHRSKQRMVTAFISQKPKHPLHSIPEVRRKVLERLSRRRDNIATCFLSSVATTTTTTIDDNNDANTIMNFTIILTRESGKNDKLREAIQKQWDGDDMTHSYSSNGKDASYRIEIIELPCIEHSHGDDYDELGSTISHQHWDYIIVTSPEAASVLLSKWPYKNEQKHHHKIAAVGVATEEILRQGGIAVDFVPSKATAETLIREIPFISSSPSSVCHVLYPASSRAENTIQNGLQVIRQELNPKEVFHVKRLNTYDTVTAVWNGQQQEQVLSLLNSEKQLPRQEKNHNVIVTVASPSSIKGWLTNTNNCTTVFVACIGETSKKACQKYGWDDDKIYFPEKPGINGWMKSIKDAVHAVITAS